MSDLEEVFEMRSDPHQLKYIQRPVHQNIEETSQWLAGVIHGEEQGEGISWAIRPVEETIMLGIVGFYRTQWEHDRTEIGYMLRKGYQGRGIMRACIPTVCQWAFTEWGVHSIMANIHPENEASRKVLLSTGFIKEAYFRENYLFDGWYFDSEIYGLLKRDLPVSLI